MGVGPKEDYKVADLKFTTKAASAAAPAPPGKVSLSGNSSSFALTSNSSTGDGILEATFSHADGKKISGGVKVAAGNITVTQYGNGATKGASEGIVCDMPASWFAKALESTVTVYDLSLIHI